MVISKRLPYPWKFKLDKNLGNEIGRILIADDHEIVRVGLRLIIDEWPEFICVGEAADGQEAVKQAGICEPNVVIMDVSMPIMDGITATGLILQKYPDTSVIMLTADNGADTVFASLASGAQGYCLKSFSPERLHAGVTCVYLGDLWLDKEIAATITEIVRNDGFKPKPSVKPSVGMVSDIDRVALAAAANMPLSSRELEILDLIVNGLSNSQIADAISISKDTVKTHVSNILRKLSASDRTHAAVKALREGLVS